MNRGSGLALLTGVKNPDPALAVNYSAGAVLSQRERICTLGGPATLNRAFGRLSPTSTWIAP